MNVHNELGCGFLEPVYQEALSLEFSELGIPFQKEKVLDVCYKQYILDKKYVADFVCYEGVIVEIKAIDTLNPVHIAQVLNYLKATSKKNRIISKFWKHKTSIQTSYSLNFCVDL